MKIFTTLVLTFLAGALCVLAFAPVNLWALSIICPCALLFFWQHASAKKAALLGLSYGFGFFLAGVSWVFVSMHQFGGMGDLSAGFFTVIFALGMALYPALNGYLLNKFIPSRGAIYYLAAFPLIGTLIEMFRGWFLTGFPWLNLGDAQVVSPVGAFAPILSSYGCTLIILFICGLLLYSVKLKSWKQYLPILVVLGIFAIGIGLKKINWTHTTGKKLQVSLVQGNIPQSIKWNPKTVTTSMQTYLTQTRANWHSDFIFWPESAVPDLKSRLTPWLNEINVEADKHDAAVMLGVPIEHPDGKIYNGATVVGRGHGDYIKQHLVPFGEYVPFSHLFGPIFSLIQVPMSDFSEGPANQIHPLMKGYPVGVFICYESAFANIVRKEAAHTSFDVVLSDDAWFGDSLGPWQHLQMAQIRALETGHYFLNDTNTGITAIIGPQGKILKSLKANTRQTLNGTIYATSGETPWVHFGFWPLALILAILLVVTVLGRKKDE